MQPHMLHLPIISILLLTMGIHSLSMERKITVIVVPKIQNQLKQEIIFVPFNEEEYLENQKKVEQKRRLKVQATHELENFVIKKELGKQDSLITENDSVKEDFKKRNLTTKEKNKLKKIKNLINHNYNTFLQNATTIALEYLQGQSTLNSYQDTTDKMMSLKADLHAIDSILQQNQTTLTPEQLQSYIEILNMKR